MVAVSPASLEHAAICVDKGSLRYGRGPRKRLRGAKRVPGRHAGTKINSLCYVHGKDSQEAVSVRQPGRDAPAGGRASKSIIADMHASIWRDSEQPPPSHLTLSCTPFAPTSQQTGGSDVAGGPCTCMYMCKVCTREQLFANVWYQLHRVLSMSYMY